MAVARMKLVNIVGRLKDFDNVVRSCCIKGNFHPEQSSLALNDVAEFTPIEEANPHARRLQRLVDIGVHSGLGLHYSDFSKLSMSDEETDAYLNRLTAGLDEQNAAVRALTQDAARLEQGITQLNHMKTLGLSLDDLFSCRYVDFRFGRLPADSYPKLGAHDRSDDLFFFPLEEEKEYIWGFYVSLKKESAEIDEVFNSLYFERLEIVSEAHGTPSEAIIKVESALAAKNKELADAKAKLSDYLKKEGPTFFKVYSMVRYLHDSFDLRRFASKCGESFYIFGWVPEEEISAFTRQFDKLSYVDCIVENTSDAENVQPPTKLKNNSASRPFESFVDMYGLPSYNEIDPTPFMAFSYTLLFGIMFADLGQGAIIALIGLFLWFKKKSSFGGILARIGASSMVFGFLFNSIFGYEGVIPFTILPVHEAKYVVLVLFSAIGLGVITILFCMGLNIANAIRQHDLGKLFFSQNGVSGLLFYASVILAFVLFALFKKNIVSPVFIICLVVIPLLIMFLKEPLSMLVKRSKDWVPKNKMEFALQSFFELFEILLSYATNTISFVRVGAYILSHAGMMFAVFALAGMGGGSNIVVVILGNAFVIALEGLIVGIQGIRLQFYEMFSRFFGGEGKAYTPAKVHY